MTDLFCTGGNANVAKVQKLSDGSGYGVRDAYGHWYRFEQASCEREAIAAFQHHMQHALEAEHHCEACRA